MKSAYAAALLAAVALPTPALAEDGEAIVVTASRTEPGGVAIIDRTRIETFQPVTALDLLDRVAGVRAFSKGGVGGGSYLSIRGGEPNFTLVLLDGVKVNDPTNSQGGAFDLAQIDPDALERIEVARGARSAIHGADALSGVVNLRLREVRAGERFGAARAAIDSEGGFGVGGTFGHGWRDGGFLASASLSDSGDLTEGSDLDRRQLLAKASHDLEAVTLTALALHARTEREAFPEDSGGPRLAVVRERERRDTDLTVMSLALTGRDERLRPNLVLNWSRQDVDADTPPIPPVAPAITADSRFDRIEVLGDLRFQPTSSLSLAAGAGYIDEDGRSRGTLDFGGPLPADFDIGRDIASGFAEATFSSGGVTATAGIRYDDASTSSGEWTGRASLRAGPFVASLSEGYKLPSLYALAYPIIANPDLKPERSRSFEAGIEHDLAGVTLHVAYFHNRFRDLIDFDPDRFTNVNRARVTTQGVEAEAEGQIAAGWRARGSLTYLDVDSATPLRSRPKWQGAASVEWQASERLALSFAGRFNDDFLDSSVPTGSIEVDGHVEFDAALRYAVTDGVSLTLTARNLLSADHEEAVGFPAPGRVVRLAIGARF